ncbi:MAG: LysR family transcriptional regulator [Novosphingobium sp.]|uniref:LysR family transcriptional regulator n=1 Tax=Novosphingobium sp. TaxID=1874826 RepID=UPI001D342D49|nr:LysR family transcriptional regulator [Novosphingobium sp.]MBX9664648.1 LysR family transcriptional regulator [Novosphingobium sp.]MBY0392141.1 LysR family transcriptional regulator [Novosphingobium sp.]
MFDPDYDLFLAIVEAGSISAAARAQGASTAALSKRLARLEERLSARLVHRTTRRLALTPAGQDLHDALLPLRSTLKAAEERVSGRHAHVRGPLRLTAPTSFGRMHVVPHVPTFLAAHPDVRLQLDLSDEFADLLDGSCDLAIRIGAKIGNGLTGHRLGTSHRVLCAAPAYLAAFGTPETLADLKHHRVLATTSQLPWQLDGPEGTVTHSGQSHVRTNSSEVVRELALGACGIALRSLWDVHEALASGALTRVLVQYQGSQDVGIYAVHAPTPALPARIEAFIAHLAAHLSAGSGLA